MMDSPLQAKLNRNWIKASSEIEELKQQRDELKETLELAITAAQKAEAKLIECMGQRDELVAALSAMLTHMGMDEDEWNKPTFDQARAAIAKVKPLIERLRGFPSGLDCADAADLLESQAARIAELEAERDFDHSEYKRLRKDAQGNTAHTGVGMLPRRQTGNGDHEAQRLS